MIYLANMFTGIIRATGIVKEVISNGSNKTFWIKSGLSASFRVDQSVSHDGICLTVEAVKAGTHRVTAIDETLQKTNAGDWQPGTIVNLEQCLSLDGLVDGHLVQGHVDTTAACLSKKEKDGSWEFTFSFPGKFAALVIEKGSICINGISLTAFAVKKKKFSVAIIPYTFEHTNIKDLQEGQTVNIEFDVIGKYVTRSLSLKEKNYPADR